jgi:mono/diheme cytochrome c family protein
VSQLRAGGRVLSLALAVAPLSGAAATPPPGDSWETPLADRDRKSPVTATPAALTKGRALFQMHCVRCHGDKGRGDGPGAAALPAEPADLSDPVFQGLLTDGEILWKVTNGRRRGKEILMPAMADKIPLEEDRWKLVAFVRSLAPPAPTTPGRP